MLDLRMFLNGKMFHFGYYFGSPGMYIFLGIAGILLGFMIYSSFCKLKSLFKSIVIKN